MPIRIPTLPKSLASISLFTGNRIACSAFHMIGGLLLVRLLEPSSLGLFNTVALANGYLAWLQLGIFNGLNRELPYFLGKGDEAKAHALASTAQAWALFLSGLSLAALCIVGIVFACMGKPWVAAACIANAFAGANGFYNTSYLNVTFRTRHDFIKLSFIEILFAVCSLLLIGLVWWKGFYGLCSRALLSAVIGIFLFHYFRPLRIPVKWVASEWKHLFKIGMPIYMVGQLYAWWSSVMTPSLIAWIEGTKMMGLFAFVTFVISASSILSMSASQVYYPRLVEAYAKHGKPEILLSSLRRPILMLAALYLVLGAAGWLALPFAITLLAPNYREAVFPAQLSMLLCPLLALTPMFNIFNVIKRQHAYLRCILFGMLVNVVALLVALRFSTGNLSAYIVAIVAGRLAFTAAAFFTIRRLIANIKVAT